jgi:hypothetical protein
MAASASGVAGAQRARWFVLSAFVLVSATSWSLTRTLGEADGVVADGGVRVFDDDVPAVANLDPRLRRALRRAAMDAAKDGIEIIMNSGWRSREYQEQLHRHAVARYGSAKAAARWVATADTSSHVSGDAVDIGPARATVWLGRRGARYGLCPMYKNEPWHFELRRDADAEGCPEKFPDPGHDPRMQQ